MPDAKIVGLCDALVSELETAWTGRGADDAVKRCYVAPVAVDRSQPFAGRKVFIFPTAYGDEIADRGEDNRAYSVSVWVAERYPDAMPVDSDDAVTWFDERVYFVESTVSDTFDYTRRAKRGATAPTGMLVFGDTDERRAWTESARVTVYDWERLVGLGLFLSQIEYTFRELVT